MSAPSIEESGVSGRPSIDVARQRDIEQFLYFEAELLDDHRYVDWLQLFTADTRYWAPTQANRLRRDRGTEASVEGEVALFDFNRTTLGWRVRQLQTSTHWAEDPPSRTRHLVSNVRITPIDATDGVGDATDGVGDATDGVGEDTDGVGEDTDGVGEDTDGVGDATEFAVRSNFICYRNRLTDEVDIWAGERRDVLRPGGAAGWSIASRTITLDQNVVLSKNLSVLF